MQGLWLLALGAGVGEETLFRAFLQTAAANGLADALPAAPAGAATAAALVGSSVVFGALHALTPLYFVFATAAGALFGELGWAGGRFGGSLERLLKCPSMPTWQQLVSAHAPAHMLPLCSLCRAGVLALWSAHRCGDALAV